MSGEMSSAPSLTSSLLLAVIQGLTEFLPVSSSGHLAAVQLLWPAFSHPGVTLEVALHLGTTVAVLIYYRRLIVDCLRRRDNPAHLEGLDRKRWLTYLLLGSLPTAAIGLAAEPFVRAAFQSLETVAISLAATGAVLMATHWGRREPRRLTAASALAIGAIQGAALLPGVSRSGVTISLALWLGIPHRQAVSYSFLLSVPAILGATALDGWHLLRSPTPAGILFVNIGFATLCAGAIGYVCIGLVHRAASGSWWRGFAWYCWSLAALLAWLAA